MLERKKLEGFCRALQTPSRIEANTPTSQVEEPKEDAKSELTQSLRKIMLERKKLEGFCRALQTPSRIEANTPTSQVEEPKEDAKSELTQSLDGHSRKAVNSSKMFAILANFFESVRAASDSHKRFSIVWRNRETIRADQGNTPARTRNR